MEARTRSYNPFVRAQAAAWGDSHAESMRSADRRAWDVAAEAWRHADAAQAALPALEAQCAAVETRLGEERATLQALRDANSRMYGELHAKRSGLNLKGKLTKLRHPRESRDGSGSPTSPTDAPWPQHGVQRRSTQEDFAASYPAEAKALNAMEETQQLLTQLQGELEVARELSSAVDERFRELREAAVVMFPPTFVSTSVQLSQALHTMEEDADAAHEAHSILFDMKRACTCVQSTHFYHRKVLRISDAVKDPKSSSLGSFGPLAQINTHNQYIAAKNESFRAQACLAEGIRLLDKHEALIPPETRRHVMQLKDLGVGQMDRIYELLYGSSFFSTDKFSKDKQIEALFDAQEKSFKHLTDLAVWLQKFLPDLERALKDALERRRISRRGVVEQWERALRDTASPPPPSKPPKPQATPLMQTSPNQQSLTALGEMPGGHLTVQAAATAVHPIAPRAAKRPLPPVPRSQQLVL